jgi:16S rRNA (guanine966-N2)-methyltransferase
LSRSPDSQFDVAFLDPPFQAGLWTAAAAAVSPWLAAQAWVYVELARSAAFTAPAGWTLHRQGQTREVRHHLYRTDSRSGAVTLDGNSPGAGSVQA